MAHYTLRIRRYSPETGAPARWQEFEVDLGEIQDAPPGK